jgi:hypothetical protein
MSGAAVKRGNGRWSVNVGADEAAHGERHGDRDPAEGEPAQARAQQRAARLAVGSWVRSPELRDESVPARQPTAGN